jgi:hypothetical protein
MESLQVLAWLVALLVGALTVGVAVLVATAYLFFRRNVATYGHIPGPRPRFPKGNADLLKHADGTRKPLYDLHAELQRMYGDVCVFYLGCTPVVLVSGALPLICPQGTNVLA